MTLAYPGVSCELCGRETYNDCGVCGWTEECQAEYVQRQPPCEFCGKPQTAPRSCVSEGPCHQERVRADQEHIRRWLRDAEEKNEAWCSGGSRRKPYPAGSDLEWLFRVLTVQAGLICDPVDCIICGRQTTSAYLVCGAKTADHRSERGSRMRVAKYGGALSHAKTLQEALDRRRQPGRPCRFALAGCVEATVPGGRECLSHSRASAERRRRKRLRGLAAAQQWACPWCARPLSADLAGLEADHVIPVSAGGPDEEWNLQVLHGPCNRQKSDQITPAALALAAEHGIVLMAA